METQQEKCKLSSGQLTENSKRVVVTATNKMDLGNF